MNAWALPSLLVMLVPSAAAAEVVTLICTTQYGYSHILDVDYANQTVCDLPSPAKPPCSLEPAQISERYISFDRGITIDRVTGIVRWFDGSTGTCKRAEKQQF
ncbi:MAG TPA: hypothetical protein VJN67_00905 [Stellaceae bacterium]|nr:hypothetical protein [Stellaceae bacterium]